MEKRIGNMDTLAGLLRERFKMIHSILEGGVLDEEDSRICTDDGSRCWRC